jgi:hypothetical protein
MNKIVTRKEYLAIQAECNALRKELADLKASLDKKDNATTSNGESVPNVKSGATIRIICKRK